MNILITLLIYGVLFIIVYYGIIKLMTLAEWDAQVIKIAKMVLIAIGIIAILLLFFGGNYIDLPRINDSNFK